MSCKIHNVEMEQKRGHWVVYIDGEFFCTADTELEAIRELELAFDI